MPWLLILILAALTEFVKDDDLAKEIKGLRFLVLDEADRMIEAGHFDELENILRLTLRENRYVYCSSFWYDPTQHCVGMTRFLLNTMPRMPTRTRMRKNLTYRMTCKLSCYQLLSVKTSNVISRNVHDLNPIRNEKTLTINLPAH